MQSRRRIIRKSKATAPLGKRPKAPRIGTNPRSGTMRGKVVTKRKAAKPKLSRYETRGAPGRMAPPAPNEKKVDLDGPQLDGVVEAQFPPLKRRRTLRKKQIQRLAEKVDSAVTSEEVDALWSQELLTLIESTAIAFAEAATQPPPTHAENDLPEGITAVDAPSGSIDDLTPDGNSAGGDPEDAAPQAFNAEPPMSEPPVSEPPVSETEELDDAPTDRDAEGPQASRSMEPPPVSPASALDEPSAGSAQIDAATSVLEPIDAEAPSMGAIVDVAEEQEVELAPATLGAIENAIEDLEDIVTTAMVDLDEEVPPAPEDVIDLDAPVVPEPDPTPDEPTQDEPTPSTVVDSNAEDDAPPPPVDDAELEVADADAPLAEVPDSAPDATDLEVEPTDENDPPPPQAPDEAAEDAPDTDLDAAPATDADSPSSDPLELPPVEAEDLGAAPSESTPEADEAPAEVDTPLEPNEDEDGVRDDELAALHFESAESSTEASDATPPFTAPDTPAPGEPAVAELRSDVQQLTRKQTELVASVDDLRIDVKTCRIDTAANTKATIESIAALRLVQGRFPTQGQPGHAATTTARSNRSLAMLGIALLAVSWGIAFYLKTGDLKIALAGIVLANLLSCFALLARGR